MKLTAKQDFSWAHRGVQIEEFKKGQVIDTKDEDLIRVATAEKWASKQRGSAADPAGDGDDEKDDDKGGDDSGGTGTGTGTPPAD